MNPRPKVHRSLRTSALLAAAALLAGCGAGSGATSGTSATGASSAASPTSVTAGAPTPTTSAPTPTTSASTPTASASASRPASSSLVPLWPFTTVVQAAQWQAAYRSGGHQPWHLDAGFIALAFARGHLGYADVDRVTSRSIHGGDARIGVGWQVSGSRTGTAAVLHLITLGSGSDAPWVVVGSDDTTLTLDVPRYGSTVASPVRVGGRITGVDESLRVIVVNPASERLFTSAGLPAGGERTPWSTVVRFSAPRGTVLTIAVSAGGHVKAVERFAVTAVRVR